MDLGAVRARVGALLHNRWALAGVAGAAGLGLLSMQRGRSSAAAGGAAAGQDASSSDAATVGSGGADATTYPNTSSTDLATALGNLDSRYAASLAEFSGQLGTDHDALVALRTKDDKTAAGLAALLAAQKKAAAAAAAKKKAAATKAKVTPKAPASSATSRTITVKKGETLSELARRYHTSVSALSKANHLKDPNRISAGAKLKVPG